MQTLGWAALAAGLMVGAGGCAQGAARSPAAAATTTAAATTPAAGPSALQDVPRRGYIEAEGGVSLYYRVEGRGPTPVLVVGGDRGRHPLLRYLLRPLAGREHALVFWDMRGVGGSAPVEDERLLTPAHHVADVERVRAHLGLEKVVVLGHGFGAGVAARYALEHPERVQRLVLVAAPPPAAPEAPRAEEARLDAESRERLAELAREWERAPSAALPELCRERFRLHDAQLYFADPTEGERFLAQADPCGAEAPEQLRVLAREAARFVRLAEQAQQREDYDWRPGLSRIRVPVLVVHPEKDLGREEDARAWAANLPDAHLLRVPGAGRLVFAEAPGVVLPALRDFLQGRTPARAERVERGSPAVAGGGAPEDE